MLVRAGHRLFLQGLTGLDLSHELIAPEDAPGQAEQAMRNAKTLLEEAGSSLKHICKLTTYFTDRAYRIPVYQVVANHLRGIPLPGTSLMVKGLALPEMKVAFDIEAVIPFPGSTHQRIRTFNLRDWFDQPVDRELCMAVRTQDEIYLRGQTGSGLDGNRMYGEDHSPGAAGEQAEQAMRNARILLEEAGSSLDDVCRAKIYLGDRAYLEPVTRVLNRHFAGVQPCTTELIVSGFTRPEILVEVDIATTLPGSTPHDHIAKQSMVRAGNRVYLRGQTDAGVDVGGGAIEIAAAQTEQAMQSIANLLPRAGASLHDVCKVTIFLVDRIYRESVNRVIGPHLAGVHPTGTEIIVTGLVHPETLVMIDVEAVTGDADHVNLNRVEKLDVVDG